MGRKKSVPYLLSEEQMKRISVHFPHSRGKKRVDDRLILSGIIYVIKNGLRWIDVPKEYGYYKTVYNRFIRWSGRGVWTKIFESLVNQSDDILMIDSTHLKAHRTACSLCKKGLCLAGSDARKAD